MAGLHGLGRGSLSGTALETNISPEESEIQNKKPQIYARRGSTQPQKTENPTPPAPVFPQISHK